MTYKYAYGTETNWQEIAERKLFAQMLRFVVTSRGRTTAVQIVDSEGNPVNLTVDKEGTPIETSILKNKYDSDLWQFVEVELSTLTDDELRPENGFALLGHCPPVTGMLQKTKGLTLKAFAIDSDSSGQEWAILKYQWSCKACVPTTALTEGQATALGASEIEIAGHPNHYMVPALPIDMTPVIDSYSWTTIQDTAPEWPTEE